MWILGINSQLNGLFFKLDSIPLYTLLLYLPIVVPKNPLVLPLHTNRIKLGFNEIFEYPLLSDWLIILQVPSYSFLTKFVHALLTLVSQMLFLFFTYFMDPKTNFHSLQLMIQLNNIKLTFIVLDI